MNFSLLMFKFKRKMNDLKRKYLPIKKILFKITYLHRYASFETIKARKLVKSFLDLNEDTYNLKYITDVFGKRKKGIFIVQIITDRPGLMIGKGGRYLDQFIDYSHKMTGEKIKINLQESNYWPSTYEYEDRIFEETFKEIDY